MRIAVLDIGGTCIKSGVFENGKLYSVCETSSKAMLGGKSLIQQAIGILRLQYCDCQGIGISTAGQVDSENGSIIYANQNIPDYTGTQVKKILEEEFGMPVFVENDVNAAAIGEARYGTGLDERHKDFICVTYGTGIGGALILNGNLFRGSSFSAGEVGRIITHGCDCPQGGIKDYPLDCYYEYHASTTALVRRAQHINPKLKDGRTILRNMESPDIQKIVDEWIEEVVLGMVSLVHIFNPKMIVAGGGIMCEERIVRKIDLLLKERIMPSFRKVTVKAAKLGNRAGMIGIGYVAATQLQGGQEEEA